VGVVMMMKAATATRYRADSKNKFENTSGTMKYG
jgi:hypothetical protein